MFTLVNQSVSFGFITELLPVRIKPLTQSLYQQTEFHQDVHFGLPPTPQENVLVIISSPIVYLLHVIKMQQDYQTA